MLASCLLPCRPHHSSLLFPVLYPLSPLSPPAPSSPCPPFPPLPLTTVVFGGRYRPREANTPRPCTTALSTNAAGVASVIKHSRGAVAEDAGGGIPLKSIHVKKDGGIVNGGGGGGGSDATLTAELLTSRAWHTCSATLSNVCRTLVCCVY